MSNTIIFDRNGNVHGRGFLPDGDDSLVQKILDAIRCARGVLAGDEEIETIAVQYKDYQLAITGTPDGKLYCTKHATS